MMMIIIKAIRNREPFYNWFITDYRARLYKSCLSRWPVQVMFFFSYKWVRTLILVKCSRISYKLSAIILKIYLEVEQIKKMILYGLNFLYFYTMCKFQKLMSIQTYSYEIYSQYVKVV